MTLPSRSGTTDRSFKVGETVHLSAKVSPPGSREPVDATVVLAVLRTGGVALSPAVTAFTRVATGDYTLSLPTVGLAPGLYEIVVRVSDGPSKVSLLVDQFALQTA